MPQAKQRRSEAKVVSSDAGRDNKEQKREAMRSEQYIMPWLKTNKT